MKQKMKAINEKKNMNTSELLLSLFNLIATGEDVETISKHAQGLISLFEEILALEADKAKPLLLSHLLDIILEINDQPS